MSGVADKYLALERGSVNIKALLTSIVEKFKPKVRQECPDLRTEIKILPVIICDGDLLPQVFTNSVEYAVNIIPRMGK